MRIAPAPAESGRQREHVPSASQTVRKPLSKRAKLTYTTLVIILCVVFLAIFAQHLPGGANPVIAKQPDVAMASMFTDVHLSAQPISVDIRNGFISFPFSILQEKKYVQFEYHLQNGTVIPLLAYISPEGKLVTSVRLCEPCNSTSFTIDGTELVCGTCGTRWKLNNLDGISGNCQKYPPAPIPSTIVGNEVRIDESLIKEWKMRI
ncbi:MAG TPA: Fe-S-containing protein [Bacteroidota bacterium]|nr:Fe-S-containing protein [Bacteroidota bacterium]